MPDSSLNDPEKQSEAREFSLALVTHQSVLLAYTQTLAAHSDDPEAAIAAANEFIQHKSKNGIKDYVTDQTYVLQAQQTLPTYVLLFWSGFYTTQIANSDTPQSVQAGPNFVIAATLDSAAPVHIGLGRGQIIEASFETLILRWTQSEVQKSSGKLVFNLVPDEHGNVRRTFAGTYDDGTVTHLFTGVAGTPADPGKASDDQQAALPPALQVIYPTIAAVGAIVTLFTGTIGAAWVILQWKDRNSKLREARARARANPEDRELGQAAEQAQGEARQAENAAGAVRGRLRDVVERLDAIPPRQAELAAAAVVGDEQPAQLPVEPGPAIEAVRAAVVDDPQLQEAAVQLARQQPPDPAVAADEASVGSEVTDGLLSEPASAGEE